LMAREAKADAAAAVPFYPAIAQAAVPKQLCPSSCAQAAVPKQLCPSSCAQRFFPPPTCHHVPLIPAAATPAPDFSATQVRPQGTSPDLKTPPNSMQRSPYQASGRLRLPRTPSPPTFPLDGVHPPPLTFTPSLQQEQSSREEKADNTPYIDW
jgi:hypothetical protein